MLCGKRSRLPLTARAETRAPTRRRERSSRASVGRVEKTKSRKRCNKRRYSWKCTHCVDCRRARQAPGEHRQQHHNYLDSQSNRKAMSSLYAGTAMTRGLPAEVGDGTLARATIGAMRVVSSHSTITDGHCAIHDSSRCRPTVRTSATAINPAPKKRCSWYSVCTKSACTLSRGRAFGTIAVIRLAFGTICTNGSCWKNHDSARSAARASGPAFGASWQRCAGSVPRSWPTANDQSRLSTPPPPESIQAQYDRRYAHVGQPAALIVHERGAGRLTCSMLERHLALRN